MFRMFHLYIFYVLILDISSVATYVHEEIIKLTKKRKWRNYSDPSQKTYRLGIIPGLTVLYMIKTACTVY